MSGFSVACNRFPLLSLPKEIPAVGSCLRLRTIDPRRADPVGPQTEGNHQQEGVPGARAGRLHRQPAGQGHGGDAQHPPSAVSAWQEGRKDVTCGREVEMFYDLVSGAS